MSVPIRRHKIKNKLTQYLNYRPKSAEARFLNIIFRHADFTKFCGIINIDVKNKSQIDISNIKLEQSVKCQKMLFRKIQNGL